MKKKKPLRDYEELLDAEKRDIIKDFKMNYLGEGIAEKYRITAICFRILRNESRK
ncbi:hypothetical protein R4036_004600 [Salmonella enterica]|nr:hypothetical protein [Salmonella enterica]